MKWFKHYSNALLSNSLSELFALRGFKGYGRYWRLLELMSEKFDGEKDTLFIFSLSVLRAELGFHRTLDLLKYLSCLNHVGIMSHTSSAQVVKIKSDILLKLQSKDYKYEKNKRLNNDPKIKTKIKNNSGNEKIKFDFEVVYKDYPNKIDKVKGMISCENQIRDINAYNDWEKAVKNYANKMLVENTAKQYIKTFKNFMEDETWREYIDYDENENPLAGVQKDAKHPSSGDYVIDMTEEEYNRITP